MKTIAIACGLLSLVGGVIGFGQTFPPGGSTGVDGALTYTMPGTYVFDPRMLPTPRNPGDILNFTTINIGAGVTLKLDSTVYNSPVQWLASGAVKIDGTIDLSGQDSFSAANTTQRTYTIAGAGGYPGGYPAVGASPGGPGLGPNGGGYENDRCNYSGGGGFSGNQFLVPLVGGSGGGAYSNSSGGAGGGAILIVSNLSISGAGSIKANGGSVGGSSSNPSSSGGAGPGGGGGIRLVAPAVTISGSLNAAGGTGNGCSDNGAAGVVRIEAFQIGAINPSGNFYTATPYNLFLSSTGAPALTVTSVNGVQVANPPTGTFKIPDVIINSNSSVTFAIQAINVPTGTICNLTIFSENGPDIKVQSTALTGTLASSSATASATLPSGYSKGFITATYTQ